MQLITFENTGTISRIIEECRKQEINEQGTLVNVQHTRFSTINTIPDKFVALAPKEEDAEALLDALTKKQPRTAIIVLSASPPKELIAPNTIFVGVRGWDKESYSALRQSNCRYYTMHALAREDAHDIADAIMEQALGFLAVHLHIDVNVLDPSFLPECTETYPGGMTSRELLYFIERLSLLRNFSTASITGWKERDRMHEPEAFSENSVRLIAKLVTELEPRERKYERERYE